MGEGRGGEGEGARRGQRRGGGGALASGACQRVKIYEVSAPARKGRLITGGRRRRRMRTRLETMPTSLRATSITCPMRVSHAHDFVCTGVHAGGNARAGRRGG